MMNDISLSSALFSNVQQRALALIFGHPERSFYTPEMVRSVHSGTGAVERDLSRLQRSGAKSSNPHRSTPNPAGSFFEDFRSPAGV
jgi:hypothetical protein